MKTKIKMQKVKKKIEIKIRKIIHMLIIGIRGQGLRGQRALGGIRQPVKLTRQLSLARLTRKRG